MICKAGLCGLKPMSEVQPGFWLQHEDACQGNGLCVSDDALVQFDPVSTHYC